MQHVSRIPYSAQTETHRNLATVLQRHCKAPYRKPYADYNQRAFTESMTRYRTTFPGWPLILDSCCGTGESTLALARQFPGHYVIGVDQSESRLRRYAPPRVSDDALPENMDLVRADLVDYWRLLLESEVFPDRHYLFYPNPWPKIGHLTRRWHGHPVFPAMLALGGIFECRVNWKIYLEEFVQAVEYVTGIRVPVEVYVPPEPISAFERKYFLSGHTLYRAAIHLS